MLTVDKLKDILKYDPDTGDFYWRKLKTKNQVKVGDKAGSYDSSGYCQIKIEGITYKAHRLAWLYVFGVNPINEIDHIDNNPSNNKITNLRDIPHINNMENQVKPRSNNKQGLLGVSKRTGKDKYRSQIQVNGRKIIIGDFDTAEDAHIAYIEAKRNYHKFSTL